MNNEARNIFDAAVEALNAKDFIKAKGLFDQLKNKYSSDYSARF